MRAVVHHEIIKHAWWRALLLRRKSATASIKMRPFVDANTDSCQALSHFHLRATFTRFARAQCARAGFCRTSALLAATDLLPGTSDASVRTAPRTLKSAHGRWSVVTARSEALRVRSCIFFCLALLMCAHVYEVMPLRVQLDSSFALPHYERNYFEASSYSRAHLTLGAGI